MLYVFIYIIYIFLYIYILHRESEREKEKESPILIAFSKTNEQQISFFHHILSFLTIS